MSELKMKCQVHILPNNGDAGLGSIYKQIIVGDFDLKDDFVGKLHININPLVNKSNERFEAHHLYFTSSEEIKEGDWCYNSIKNTWDEDIILYQGAMPQYHYKGFQKIVATTDKSLGLPLIPESFIRKYVEKQGNIKEVYLDLEKDIIYPSKEDFYEGTNSKENIRLKLRPDNTVIVSKVKDTFTKEEVEKMAYDILNLGMKLRQDQLNGWEQRSGNEILEEWFKQNIN